MADQSGLNLSKLPEILGVSKPSLFAYRSGKNRITAKVWLKLERAEREVRGEGAEGFLETRFVESDTKLNQPASLPPENHENKVQEDATPYRFTPIATQREGRDAPENGLKPVLERIAAALEKLVEIEQDRNLK